MSHSDSMRYWSRGPFIHVDELRNYFAPEDTSGWKTWAIVKVSEDQAIGHHFSHLPANVSYFTAVASSVSDASPPELNTYTTFWQHG
ncbi:hypothetical protein VTO58DRAFT_103466 [Aureobasidium pullulans]